MSNFAFLQREWFAIHDTCVKAESYVNSDARAACFYGRIALEQMVAWLYRYDRAYHCYDESLGARVHEPCFKNTAGEHIFAKSTVIISIGNRAAHGKSTKPADAVTLITELFHVAYWLARTYGERERPNPALQFDANKLPPARTQAAIPIAQLEQADEKLKQQEAANAVLREELAKLQAEVARVRAANAAIQDTHDYNEQQTRDYFIDLLLYEAGFALDKPQDREYEVSGMPNNEGKGFVDYVLWGNDGLPLAVVEAKRTKRDARVGQQQAKLYADCLQAKFNRRPVIYYTNGYEHHFWDDSSAPPRKVQGFHSRDELELMMQRRTSRASLATAKINEDIAGRAYQQQAIRSVAEAIETHNQRRSLVVMATGAGKTRTVIALVDLLMRANYVKRVLFLADRVSLVKQATREFSKHLPSAGIVNLLEGTDASGRVYVSTYPTMLNLVNNNKEDVRKFGIGYFDLVIVDEAHRSIYAKYGALFDYFDSYLVGLTATPKNEVDHNTYRLFQLERGVPTFAYSLEDAIKEKYLVPPLAVSVPLRFQREGIKYENLSEEEKQQWDELDWGEGEAPDEISSSALNQWLFNEDTVDRVLQHLMTKGEHVASGDRIGKTIIFAKNNDHAEFIAERFNVNYPQYKGTFARVITFKTEYAQSLIESFSKKDSEPHIAISVDMLDTGIDVPEILNLVFFKQVHSRTKFWQMIGRGTRLCNDVYAPNKHKSFFYIFDFCQNFEYFNQNPDSAEGSKSDSLDTRLFKMRLELLAEIDSANRPKPTDDRKQQEQELRSYTADLLHDIVSNMTLDNIIVRPQRKYLEKYSVKDVWKNLSKADGAEIAEHLANLPSQLRDTEEEAKRFDFMILSAQICTLQMLAVDEKIKSIIQKIMSALELQNNIPAIRAQMPLIQTVAGEEWWEGVTVGMLEHVRKQLRMLIKLIEKTKRNIVYTDFEDELGEGTVITLPIANDGIDYERFKLKTRDFLREHSDNLAFVKLRKNLPITATDLAELERILLEQASGDKELVAKAREEANGLGLFVRSLVGLEREAANEAMAKFLNDANATAKQITFVRLIVDQLTQDGAMSDARLYESPFTDVAATGPNSVFAPAQVTQLFAVMAEIRQRAVA
jgi:type I restriction enzyme, R subunit